MNSFAHKLLKTAILTILIGCMLCASAFADTAYVMQASRVYQNPDTTSASAKLSAGTKVELVAEKGGWAKVRMNGNTGYMNAAALARVVTYSGKTVYAASSASVYKSFDTSSKKLGTLSAGTQLQLEAIAGEWALVRMGGKKGFVKKSQLTTDAPAQQVETPKADEAVQYVNLTAYAAQDGVKAYKSYATDSGVVAMLSRNTPVKVTAIKGDWCRVESNGKAAFMKKDDLSESQKEEEAPAATQSNELKYGDKGAAVEALQERLKELGYFGGSVGGNYLDQTQAAVAAFQTAAKLTADGVAGPETLKALASDSAPKAPKETTSSAASSGQASATPAKGTAKEMDWWTSGIQTIFARETVATITDIETGLSWREIRKGGSNHADVQPLTAADTAVMKQACGSWSWERRAIWVTINGVNYAASMNCMPHGGGSITNNNFNGHHCIHFTNSRTHGTNRVCPKHQAAIKKAASVTR